jgi:Fic family protein
MARSLAALAEEDRNKIKTLGKAAPSALRVHRALLQAPVLSIGKASEMTDLWFSSLTTALKHLQKLEIVKEVTGRKRNRLFAYERYIKMLSD